MICVQRNSRIGLGISQLPNCRYKYWNISYSGDAQDCSGLGNGPRYKFSLNLCHQVGPDFVVGARRVGSVQAPF
jgi:hypothetical protein